MDSIHQLLTTCIQSAVTAIFPTHATEADPDVRRSQHADFQSGVALPLGKKLGCPPRQVAEQIAQHIGASRPAFIASVDVAGPGFLNLTVDSGFLIESVSGLLMDSRLGVALASPRQRIVIDYSGPNVAKEMHVGHLRSTIIGDALVRVLQLQGHDVIRQNHLGDWGTPFGMLIEHLVDLGEQSQAVETAIGELNRFYQAARQKFDADPAFKERARLRVVALQGGDAESLRLWQRLVALSKRHFMDVYRVLGIALREEDFVGESHYNPWLVEIVEMLSEKGLAQESRGAICVFPSGFVGREGEPLPLIVRKQDGGFGYATTDLAALRYRVDKLGADRILYVVGAPQAQHLEMVFATARLANWVRPETETVHVAFGSVLGQDKKVLKSRSGDTVKLIELLEEGVARARAVVQEKAAALPADEVERIGHDVGIGAIKYADLSNDRSKDYVFDWSRMLAFDGDTAPYLMYAHARICSILRKAGIDGPGAVQQTSRPVVLEPAERALILQFLDLPTTIERTAVALQPHRLCRFLYDLATGFTRFYETCPVLRAEAPEQREFRIALCALTARTLALGLDLLGIAAPTRM